MEFYEPILGQLELVGAWYLNPSVMAIVDNGRNTEEPYNADSSLVLS